jgi:hypothetical protein
MKMLGMTEGAAPGAEPTKTEFCATAPPVVIGGKGRSRAYGDESVRTGKVNGCY